MQPKRLTALPALIPRLVARNPARDTETIELRHESFQTVMTLDAEGKVRPGARCKMSRPTHWKSLPLIRSIRTRFSFRHVARVLRTRLINFAGEQMRLLES